MSTRSGQSVTVEFVTSDATGAVTDADTTPSGVLVINGTDQSGTVAFVTITHIDTGRYKSSVVLPSLSLGDVSEIVISATVGGVSAKAVVWRDVKDLIIDSDGVVEADMVKSLGTTVSLYDGTVQTSGSNSTTVVVLDASSSDQDNYYRPRALIIVDGTNAGQATFIKSYTGSDKHAIVSPPLNSPCDNTSKYIFDSPNGLLTTLTEAYAADGAEAAVGELLYMIWSKISQGSISGTAFLSKKLDGTTDAMQFTLTIDGSGNVTNCVRVS